MKFGFFGGGILLMLTLIFSYIAIQNNKIAREITMKSFNLDSNKSAAPATVPAQQKDEVPATVPKADTNISTPPAQAEHSEPKDDKWQKFDDKFKDFDKKFEKF